jgi:hypothetical protein
VIRTNKDKLVKIAVGGEVSAPKLHAPTNVDSTGRAFISIGMAGIVYNAHVGDLAFGWKADHIEPGVSIHHPEEQADYAMHYLTCVGNDAVVTTGDAAGAWGRVSGEHARLLIDFSAADLDKLNVGDKIVIQGYGVGLELLDFPQIMVRKCSPELVENMGLEVTRDGKLAVPVTHLLAPRIMGSGLELIPEFVDQDMMSEDRALMAELGYLDLRLGDLVAILDQDHSYGRGYKDGAVVIGLINHGDSAMTGHGPGVMTLFSCAGPDIVPVIDSKANIANYLPFPSRVGSRGK